MTPKTIRVEKDRKLKGNAYKIKQEIDLKHTNTPTKKQNKTHTNKLK